MPTQEEIKLFRWGGHHAETLAAISMSKRLGIEVAKARKILKEAAR